MNSQSVMRAVRQPTSAAVAGLVFAGILSWVLVLLHDATAGGVDTTSRWTDDASARALSAWP